MNIRSFLRNVLLCGLLLLSQPADAITIFVKTPQELITANDIAKPGDRIVLANGEWRDITINLTCNGDKEKPVIVTAETPGKVVITGLSKLKIGGNFIVIDGLFFAGGFSGEDAVITFKSGGETANHCQVTNTVIRDYNNPKRLSDNYWVALYGKNNRLDHCSFINKTNLGVLVAVILDDERSRENFHSIDHNYFGYRLPLASNAGEIIRVGISNHCEFNSNTHITANYFEHCDGEGEVISIKSCRNIVSNNVFMECQGSVVLRHGNYNLVENNLFYGNNKEGTGGVRVINKGQWVVNNYFYMCRGTGFRSPLVIMNGVPNSPANRYLEVSDAVICNNSFYECSPFSLCEGSDAERSVQPHNVAFLNNLFYNSKDTQLYQAFDDISKIRFHGNMAGTSIRQSLLPGFTKGRIRVSPPGNRTVPILSVRSIFPVPDSLLLLIKDRMAGTLTNQPGLPASNYTARIFSKSLNGYGASWFRAEPPDKKQLTISCKTAEEITKVLAENKNKPLHLKLTSRAYYFTSPLHIQSNVIISSDQAEPIAFSFSSPDAAHFLLLEAGYSLSLDHLQLDLRHCAAKTFITTDTSGASAHSNLSLTHCTVYNCAGDFLTGARSSVCDSIAISQCSFRQGKGSIITMMEEMDNKGYYNAERTIIRHCSFIDHRGRIIAILRSGKDESTMGPLVIFSNNKLYNCSTDEKESLITLSGVQRSLIEKNSFNFCNTGKTLIHYTDWVRAAHVLRNNSRINSGDIQSNEYVRLDKE